MPLLHAHRSRRKVSNHLRGTKVTQSNPALRKPAEKRIPRYYGQLSLSLTLTFLKNSNRLIRTSVNADNGHLFLAQESDWHGKSASLMRKIHYQLLD